MPPRISWLGSLKPCTAIQHPAAPAPISRAFTTTPSPSASTVAQKRRHRDPYALAQTRARRAANLSRQEVLKKERISKLGDPVRGVTTPFIESFDTGIPQRSPASAASVANSNAASDSSSRARTPRDPEADSEPYLNFFLTPSELTGALQKSAQLSTPASRLGLSAEEELQRHQSEHANAVAALQRITALSNGSSKDRLRVNIQRCITAFGRHNTESTLPPRAPALSTLSEAQKAALPSPTPRAGPDTGSSEVQVAILTAKIRTLADFLDRKQGPTRGRGDKVNKRNLRLLVHRRQKLLSYLRRKERGGPRWTNLIETLGLTEGTWRGEISL
ncbi:hypothetical protein LTR28_004800 [Elasticomyces elasticus]|nr:hypothetical protein LTR28_004800 [Elasticomyces elasticus]